VRELARAAYPLIIEQLTGQGVLAPHTAVDFVHPAARRRAPVPAGKAPAWCEAMEKKHGWQWSRAPQHVVFMGSAWAIWSDMVRGKRICFDEDPVLRANLAHTVLRSGDTGLFVPSKGRSRGNIDAVTACCMAVKVMNDREMLAQSMYGVDATRISF
jgi:hypothetical protein